MPSFGRACATCEHFDNVIDWCRLAPEGARRRPDDWCAEWVGGEDATRAVERERDEWAKTETRPIGYRPE